MTEPVEVPAVKLGALGLISKSIWWKKLPHRVPFSTCTLCHALMDSHDVLEHLCDLGAWVAGSSGVQGSATVLRGQRMQETCQKNKQTKSCQG